MARMIESAAGRAVLLVLLLVGCAGAGAPPSQTPQSSQTPAPLSTTATAEATAIATAIAEPSPTLSATPDATSAFGPFPATVLGLPVVNVSEAQQLAAAGQLDGRLIAVGGYWMQFALPCAFMPHEALLTGFCTGSQFGDTADDVRDYNGGGVFNGSAPISAPETANGDLLWSTSGDSPAAVVLIVHAGDGRTWQCKPADRAACQVRMVIDSVAWVNGALTELNPPSGDLAPRLSMDDLTAMTAKSEQLVTAYPLRSDQLNEVDPRLLGSSDGTVWYLRLAKTPADDHGIGDGVVRLISDATSAVVGELPLEVATDYQPGRLILDSQGGADAADQYPHVTVTADGKVLASDTLDLGTTPITLEMGTYEINAFLAGANGLPDDAPQCSLPINVEAGSNVAYNATFTSSGCDWAPEDSQY